jgi:hypothetical protein
MPPVVTGHDHAYRIARDGLHIFPRLAESVTGETYELLSQRMSSGIPAIDEMLADGYWPGASIGWSLADEPVELMYRSPVALYLDEWF